MEETQGDREDRNRFQGEQVRKAVGREDAKLYEKGIQKS